MPGGTVIAPSILAADYARLGAEVKEAEEAGARWFQVDVMDGHYVPNISIGLPVLESLRAVTDSFLDVHLMISNPEAFIDPFAEAGADLISIHVEASTHLHGDLHRIRDVGCYAGVAINPATPAEAISEVLGYVDLILVMTVNPGFGGQTFIAEALPKIGTIRRMIDERGLPDVPIQVDGGIGPRTAPLAAAAGASVFVAGSSVFRWEPGIAANFAALRDSLSVAV
ncbi:MAG: ribulose-phosphate 3-epimerase [Gemmatimonadota bacterium]|nr:ribulose-phosphate 3-epimerase [Gemmatimonadota bacterium]